MSPRDLQRPMEGWGKESEEMDTIQKRTAVLVHGILLKSFVPDVITIPPVWPSHVNYM